ncbi:MAG: zinc metallopeptidase [Coriobacteriia bacterium]|nr:zinc metallopeptidase [Coriobacteriia bacterium]
MTYLLLIIVTLVMGFATQAYINSSYSKYSKVSAGVSMTGAQMAEKMLRDNGVTDVVVKPVSGTLTDHYDPRSKTVNLSEGVYGSSSIAALAVACHECGHAVQHATKYAPMTVRSALIPLANFGSSAWMVLLIIGILLNIMGLVLIACIVYGFAVLFQVVTLPVEFNASSRALSYLKSSQGLALQGSTYSGAKTVLRAAALTYVAAALTSIMQLLYYLSIFTSRR